MNSMLFYTQHSYFKDHTEIDCHWFEGNSTVHSHDYYEIFIVSNGSLYHNYLNKKTEFQTGEVALICPNRKHSIEAAPRAKHFNISFSRKIFYSICDLISPTFVASLNSIKSDYKLKLSALEYEYISSQINSSFNPSLLSKSVDTSFVTCLAIIHQLLTRIYLQYFLSDPHNDTLLPKHFSNFLECLSDPKIFTLPLQETYQLSGYSPSMVIRHFKKYLNTTPKKYITQLKISYAQNLLKKTNSSVLDISLDLGFDSLSHFITLFKNIVGKTPYEYRKYTYSESDPTRP